MLGADHDAIEVVGSGVGAGYIVARSEEALFTVQNRVTEPEVGIEKARSLDVSAAGRVQIEPDSSPPSLLHRKDQFASFKPVQQLDARDISTAWSK